MRLWDRVRLLRRRAAWLASEVARGAPSPHLARFARSDMGRPTCVTRPDLSRPPQASLLRLVTLLLWVSWGISGDTPRGLLLRVVEAALRDQEFD